MPSTIPSSPPANVDNTSEIMQGTVPKATKAVTNVSKNLLAGAAARSIAASILFPLDVIKTRMQFQQNTSHMMKYQYANAVDAGRTILRREGLFAFYKGLPLKLIYITPAAAISFTIYENLKKGFMPQEENSNDISPIYFVLFGAIARIFGTACRTPLDLLKQSIQVENQVRESEVVKRGLVNTIRQVYLQNGLRSFWGGYGVTLLRDVPFASIYFVSYEVLKRSIKNVTEDVIDTNATLNRDIRHLFCGSMAGAIATSFTIPVDVVKTRLQTQSKLGTRKYHGVVDAFSKIYREEGIKAFRKGLGPRLSSLMPSAGLTFALYEKLKTWPFFESFAAPDPTIQGESEGDEL